MSFCQSDDVSTVIQLQGALRFNGGGHLNHSIFWETLAPKGGSGPSGELKNLIVRDFGSVETMQEKLAAASVAVQGSGWGWLGYDKGSKSLKLATCPNQDPLEATTGKVIHTVYQDLFASGNFCNYEAWKVC